MSQQGGWDADHHVLWQAGVAGYVLNSSLWTSMLTMPLNLFLRMVNTMEIAGTHPLRVPLLMYALYRQWAKDKDLMPVVELTLGEGNKDTEFGQSSGSSALLFPAPSRPSLDLP